MDFRTRMRIRGKIRLARETSSGHGVASVPGLPRSVRVLIMKNVEGLGLSITWGKPGVDAMQGALWVESTAIKNAIELQNRF